MKLFPKSTIAKKLLMALSGLALILFLIVHLLGNFFLYEGEKAFNLYAYKLHQFGFLFYFIETLLFLTFFYHIAIAINLSIESKKARNSFYVKIKRWGKSTIASRYMAISGSLILIFLILHITTFKIWDKSEIIYDNLKMENVYANVVAWFALPWYSLVYIIASIGLGLHLKHAFYSAFKTFGLDHYKYLPLIKGFSLLFAILISIGFASFPIYFGFLKKLL